MKVLHETEKPRSLITASLLQALPRRTALLRVRHLIFLHALVSKLLLAIAEPARSKGRVGKHEEARDGYDSSSGTFDDE
jgi:hypothetical protein